MRWKWKATASGRVDQWGGDARLPDPEWALERAPLLPTAPALDGERPAGTGVVTTVRIGEW